MTIQPVSEEHRRRNQAAIRKRASWRRNYAFLSQAIRETKGRISRANHNNTFDPVAEAQLRALRLAAHFAMYDREDIKWMLRDSAYTYCEREMLQAA